MVRNFNDPSEASAERHMKVSVICPARNESESLPILLEEFHNLFERIGEEYEVVVVDDASTDDTRDILKQLSKRYGFLKCGFHRRRQGKTGGIVTGAEIASGDILVVFDADLQYGPDEIPKLPEPVLRDRYDIVSGWRQGIYEKGLAARIYNFLLRTLFHVPLHDSGATLALRKEIVEELNLHFEWHRFIVPLAIFEGYRVGEVKINLYPRRFGQSKYQGIFRLLVAFLDLVAVKLTISFSSKPMLVFGTTGLILLTLGLFFGLIYAYSKLTGLFVAWRMSVGVITLLVIAGILCVLGGFLAELIVDVRILAKRILKNLDEKKQTRL